MDFQLELEAIIRSNQHLIKPGCCMGTRRNGEPCKRQASKGEHFCSSHGGSRKRRVPRDFSKPQPPSRSSKELVEPDPFERWCAEDRRIVLEVMKEQPDVKPALVVLPMLEPMGYQVQFVACPPASSYRFGMRSVDLCKSVLAHSSKLQRRPP